MKRILTLTMVITAVFCSLDLQASLFSFVGKAGAKKVAGEVMEEGTEKLLKKVALEIGEAGAENVLKEGGAEGLEFVAKHGAKGADFVSKFGKTGLKAAMSEGGERIIKLTSIYGDDVIKIAQKHPGTGLKLIEELGEQGAVIASRNSTETVNKTLRYLPEMTEKGLRNKYLFAIESEGAGLFKRAGKWVADNLFKTVGLGAGLYFAVDPEGFAEHVKKGVIPIVKEGAKVGAESVGIVVKEGGKGVGSFIKSLVPQWAVTTAFFVILFALFIRISKTGVWIKNFFKNMFRKKVPEKRAESSFENKTAD